MKLLEQKHVDALNMSRLRIITGDEDHSPKWHDMVSDYLHRFGVAVDEVAKEPLDSVAPEAGDIMIVVRALIDTLHGEGGVSVGEVVALRDRNLRVPLILVTGSTGNWEKHVQPILQFTDHDGYADYIDPTFGGKGKKWFDAFTSAVIGVVGYWNNNYWK